MNFEIIDFHTHPFIERHNNICSYKDIIDMNAENSRKELESLGITKICGSVVGCLPEDDKGSWEVIKRNNEQALVLKEMYGDFYVPGFHVHPDYIDESINEIHRMHEKGVNLI